jgi:hypothetical protein
VIFPDVAVFTSENWLLVSLTELIVIGVEQAVSALLHAVRSMYDAPVARSNTVSVR